MKLLLLVPAFALIGLAVHDLFHTLFHPAGRGAVSDRVSRFVWRIFRSISTPHNGYITLAGPVAILAIMAMWVILSVFGFALLYYPFIATQFALASGLDPQLHKSFTDAFNVSLGTLVTVGGDFNAKSKLIRFAMGIEATLGFGLLTASVSWLLSIYPALERRRTLAHEATLLHFAEENTGYRIEELPPSESQSVLWGFAASMASCRNDLTQFPVIYYFRSGDSQSGFSGTLSYFAELAESASRSGRDPSIRMAGIALGGALDDYLEFIADAYLRMSTHDKEAIMRCYAAEHLRPLMQSSRRPLRRAG
ncbi:MAG TPA: hypothetical protein VN577_13965 [Terriglobales bacterium]|nr:hypothetical protein [Terriglobales bacterium]